MKRQFFLVVTACLLVSHALAMKPKQSFGLSDSDKLAGANVATTQANYAALPELISMHGFESDVSITSFVATPDYITETGTTTLSWTVESATSCTPSDGTGEWASLVIELPNGSAQVDVPTIGVHTFTLTCQGMKGSSDVATTTVTRGSTPVECNVTLSKKIVRDWVGIFNSEWPAPSQAQIRVAVPKNGYYAVKFNTGTTKDAGLLNNIEASGTFGTRFGALSEIAGCFDVTDECKHVWGRAGGITWDTTGTDGNCQLKPNTDYYWNMTFTDGISPGASTCSGSTCETYLFVINPD